jgi:LDH2 family malate/lactate/ureidoglycolate dehydrogenase
MVRYAIGYRIGFDIAMLIPVEIVVETAERALMRVAPEDHAKEQVDLLLEADLRGVASHGMLRLPRIVRRIESGATDPRSTGTHAWRRDGFLSVDGGRGLGPVVANAAIRALEKRVGRTGIAVAAVRNANHIGMLGYYAERAAKRGFSMIALSTSEALVHPWGGGRAMIGTNPVAIGQPVGGGEVFMMDVATSTVSMGEIHDHANRGAAIPEGWALDAEGRPTTNAAAAKLGAIAPMAGPKGYALGLGLELLVSALAGAAIGRDVAGTLDDTSVCNKGDVFILIDGPAMDLRPYLAELRSERPAQGFERVLIPGERGRGSRARRLAEGLDLPDALWAEIERFADPVASKESTL